MNSYQTSFYLQVSHSCKNVLRLFMINPTAMAIINCEENMRNEGGQGIINSMMELRDILLQKLLTTPEEEMERTAYLEDISRKERHNQAVIERLEKELNEAVTEKNEGVKTFFSHVLLILFLNVIF